MSIAHNEYVNLYNRRMKAPVVFCEELFDIEYHPEYDQVDCKNCLEILRNDKGWRCKALVLYSEGFLYREIADILHKPINTIKTGIRLARSKANEFMR